MKIRIAISIASLSIACGELAPDAPDGKLGGANNGGANNGGANNGPANNGLANNGANNGEVPADAMTLYGTEGPRSVGGWSPNFNALCDLEDVRTDDVGETVEVDVPAGPWPDPVEDAAGRCGDDLETVSWRLMNCERFGAGLAPLDCDLRLVWLGRAHSVDMLERGYFAHDNPDGETPFERMTAQGIAFGGAAENIGASPTPLDGHWAWMDSSGHRGNILGAFDATGVGVVRAGRGIYLTTPFIESR